ncbi:MAG: glycosyl transferase family 2, partial [Deltaproteobacteria bacterium]
ELSWLAYGDQGIFVRREVFHRLGGFPSLALMEDLFFMKRLRKEGRLALLDGPLHVSARRWEKQGVIRQTARNWTLTLLAHLGISPNRLANFYPHVR